MGKVIVITGGGSGLGRALARRLASDGHTLALLGRQLPKIEAVTAELANGALAVTCDISDPSSVDAAFQHLADQFGQIDALVNNAGVFEPFMIADASATQIRTLLDTNLAGPILCSRAALPLFGRGGHIINIGSETVVIPVAMLSLYQTAKAGLERFSRTMSQELAPRGIRVTMVRAGKMYEPGMPAPFAPETARRFAEENLKIGVDTRTAAISQFSSIASVIAPLLDLPDDVNIPEITFEGRHP